MAALTEKQATFVQEYLIDLNATQAAVRAGYSKGSAARYAVELLNKNHVAEAIRTAMQERNRRVEISQDRILEELARIAFGDLRDAVAMVKFAPVLGPEARKVRFTTSLRAK